MTVSFLGARIPRIDLPNVQDIPLLNEQSLSASDLISSQIIDYLPDCSLPNITFSESPLDVLLLSIFRGIVQKETGWKSGIKGIKGLLEEGKHFMLSINGTAENQHQFVRNTLSQLMTPFLPPFYRIFMSGIIPSEQKNDPNWLLDFFNSLREILPDGIRKYVSPGSQLGPWFYAPALTSFVTPVFLNFLVGPSRMNRRKDGQLGGLVVEKCKFLQESGCKGLCLHQCKLPAQQFFENDLGLQLTVSPNFVTQECQWSWGEKPVPVSEDLSFPKGCLVGCPTRTPLTQEGNYAVAISSCNKES
jgi:hypothetical protein